ncbi:MAG: AtpZ/AtpI family protein [Planctomycetaceae bacterium]|jgi:F0F1-type ATP synthase assembly protein I|nr:AtpZ/AtpI family protein [Planctomycetaceae bacterium]
MKSQERPSDAETDVRSPAAQGYAVASTIISMGFELAVPIVLGVITDYKFGTKCLFLIFGVFLGFTAMVVNLTKLAKTKKLGKNNVSEKTVKPEKFEK